jgi:hypothetical protein
MAVKNPFYDKTLIWVDLKLHKKLKTIATEKGMHLYQLIEKVIELGLQHIEEMK